MFLQTLGTKGDRKTEETKSRARIMDFATEQRNLIIAANKAFGEGKWNHTVVSQTLGTYVSVIKNYK